VTFSYALTALLIIFILLFAGYYLKQRSEDSRRFNEERIEGIHAWTIASLASQEAEQLRLEQEQKTGLYLSKIEEKLTEAIGGLSVRLDEIETAVNRRPLDETVDYTSNEDDKAILLKRCQVLVRQREKLKDKQTYLGIAMPIHEQLLLEDVESTIEDIERLLGEET
jgi:hypothetical protein